MQPRLSKQPNLSQSSKGSQDRSSTQRSRLLTQLAFRSSKRLQCMTPPSQKEATGSDSGAGQLITMLLILLGAANKPTGLQPAQRELPSTGRR